jgi:ribosomal protein S18 acetylase RimI-like enzyme
MAVLLTRATDADVPEIVALMNRAYRGGPADAWNSESWMTGTRTDADLLREQIAAHPEGFQLVWRRAPDAPIHGAVWLTPKSDDVWYLGSLTIDLDEQSGGHGRELLAAAESWVSAHGGRTIRMTVINIRAGLLAWYERRGYSLTDETEPFPYGDDRFGVPSRDDLHFVILKKQLL